MAATHVPDCALLRVDGVSRAQVLSAADALAGGPAKVAIKKFTRPFETSEDAKRVFREIHILRLFSEDGSSAPPARTPPVTHGRPGRDPAARSVLAPDHGR